MLRKWLAAVAMLVLAVSTANAQDARTVVGNASKAMGIEGLNSIYLYGTAQTGNLGQNNNANQPWPMAAQNDYARAIDFSQPASRATWATYAVPVTGGRATLAQGTPQTQQLITPQTQGWANQLEIWVTPWGFLKGAAANNATVKAQNVDGRRYQVVTWNSPVKSPGGQAYRLVGYINNQNLVERVQTWVENPIFGDMLVESEYSNYRDNNGLKFPATIVQKRGGWPTFEAYVLGAHANPSNLQTLMTPTPPPAGRGGGPGGAPGGPGAAPGPRRRSWPTVCSASTAPITRSLSSSPITSFSSSLGRRTRRAPRRSLPRRRR